MSSRWYYTHDHGKRGPFSDQQLRDLADSGQIVASDTVWKDGVDQGVPARKVKNLFPPVVEPPAPDAAAPAGVAQTPAPTSAPATDPPSSGETPVLVGDGAGAERKNVTAGKPAPARPQPPPAPKARAVAGKGAVLVGQDGTNVKYRKKCTACGYEDTSWNTMRIINGLTRVPFFCPKCRHKRDVEIQGFPK